MTPVGTLDGPWLATVDEAGQVTAPGARWSLDWWIGADDRWHFPSRESAVRQSLVSLTPVVETAMRVPSGDAVQRVYAVHGDEDLAVVEITNQSSLPFAVAFAVRSRRRVASEGNVVTVGGRPAVVFPRAPRIVDGSYLFPLPHRAALRVALPMRTRRSSITAAKVIESLPASDRVARGWRAQADRGMRFSLPPGRVADAIDANRIRLLLHGRSRHRAVARVLVLYGFRAGPIPPLPPEGYERLDALVASASPTFTCADEASWLTLLTLARGLLVRETTSPPGLALLPDIPEAWLGQSIEVHDAPTAYGLISYALRWHGERPALLWEGARVRVSAPGLDPSWSSDAPSGEALLAPLAGAR